MASIDLKIKDTRVFCVLKVRTKKRILPFVKKYINTIWTDDEEDEIHSIRKRVFSDSFGSYQESYFDNRGFILKNKS